MNEAFGARGVFTVRTVALAALVGCAGATPASDSADFPSVSHQENSPHAPNVEQAARPRGCGVEPSLEDLKSFEAAGVQLEFRTCVERVSSKLNGAQLGYLHSAGQTFPLGFGLEDTVRANCLTAPAKLGNFFRDAGVCSGVAQAMLALRCVRGGAAPSGCGFLDAVREYFHSSEDAEWWSIEGDALPVGVTTNRHGQRVPLEFASVVTFLDYLAAHVDPGPYDPKHTTEMDAGEVEPHLSPGTITFWDVNWAKPLKATRGQVLRELAARRGPTFTALTQLGWVYGAGAPQISRLEFRGQGDLRVALPERYDLTFERRDGSYVLVEVRQLMQSDL